MNALYCGMSYEQASREAARLIDLARRSGSWFDLPEKLTELRNIMRRDVVGATKRLAKEIDDDILAQLDTVRA